MDGLFGVLGQFFEWFGRLFPRVVIIRATHAGIAFVRGKHKRLWKAGLHVYWPFWTQYLVTPVVRQTLNLTEQTLLTKDHRTIAVNGIVIYEIADVTKILGEVYDADQAISDMCLAAMKSVILNKTLDELATQGETVDKELTAHVRAAVRPFGVRVIQAMLSDLAPCRVIKRWGVPTPISPHTSRDVL